MHPTHGGNLVWAAAIAGCQPEELLDFSASINPWGPPASVIAALTASLDSIRGYPDPQCRVLVTALAAATHLPPQYLLVGNGAAELLTWVGRECSGYERTYLITPAFADYQRAIIAFGGTIVPLPLEQVQSGFEDIAPHLTANTAIIINNPHNPTGHLWSRADLVPLLQTGALVVVDEAFMDFLPPKASQTLLDSIPDAANLIVLRSLTKFYALAGLRLGYVAAWPDRLERWQRWRDPWSVNHLAIVAGVAALGDRPFQEKTWQWLAPARQALQTALDQLSGFRVVNDSHANYLLVAGDRPILPLQRYLIQHHRLLIRDCLSFPELGNHYFRIAVRRPSENERLLTALREYCALSEGDIA